MGTITTTIEDQVSLRVESALCQIGLIEEETALSTRNGTKMKNSSKMKNSVDEGMLLEIVKRELTCLQNLSDKTQAEIEEIAQWKCLLAPIPYHVALDILTFCKQVVYGQENLRDLVGYFGRDPMRKCHLIFRSLYMTNIPSPFAREGEVIRGSYMWFIMRHARHLTCYSAENLYILDQWMQPPRKSNIESVTIMDTYSTVDGVNLRSVCPTILSACKSICAAAIGDNVLKFNNLSHLTLHSNFAVADCHTVKQLPAHSLSSLKMIISSQEHVRFLSDVIDHCRNLKELDLQQLHTGDVWSDVVARALRNAPPTLRRLSYFHCTFDYDDNMRVKITPGMFSSIVAQSIEELYLRCWVRDLSGLAGFPRLRTLFVQSMEDAKDVQAIYSALRHAPSLTELTLHFTWEDYDKPFTPVLPILAAITTEFPRLQTLDVSIYTFGLNVLDSDFAQFLLDIARTKVSLQWSMHEHIGCVSFSPSMYRSFMTVLFHPKLRYLLYNFYADDRLRESHTELSEALENVDYVALESGQVQQQLSDPV